MFPGRGVLNLRDGEGFGKWIFLDAVAAAGRFLVATLLLVAHMLSVAAVETCQHHRVLALYLVYIEIIVFLRHDDEAIVLVDHQFGVVGYGIISAGDIGNGAFKLVVHAFLGHDLPHGECGEYCPYKK